MGERFGFPMSFFLFLSGEEVKDIGKAVEVFHYRIFEYRIFEFLSFACLLPSSVRTGDGRQGF